MVKHPTYIRQSLQIRERCGFESRPDYQIFGVFWTKLGVDFYPGWPYYNSIGNEK